MLSQLHEACVQGDLDVVQGLHNGGASVNAGTTEGFRSSPLHLACFNGHLWANLVIHRIGLAQRWRFAADACPSSSRSMAEEPIEVQAYLNLEDAVPPMVAEAVEAEKQRWR